MIARLSSVLLVLACLQGFFGTSNGLPDWVTPDIIEMVAGDKVRCMEAHGTTQDLIDDVNKGNILNDPKITCYMNCLFETFGVIDEDTGDFESDMLLGLFPESIQAKGRSVLETCGAEVGADRCDRLYKLAICIYSSNPELWFML